MRKILKAACLPAVALIAGCGGGPTIPVAKDVDIDRFMGDWYVIADVPTRFEVGARNAIESFVSTRTAASRPRSLTATGRSMGPRK